MTSRRRTNNQSPESEPVTRWKVRCYNCGWLPSESDHEKARAQKHKHKRECGEAEIKRVSAFLAPTEIWCNITASDLGIEKQ